MSRAFLSVLALAVTALVACGGETASAPCSQPPRGSTVALVYRVAAADARGTAARLCTRLSTPGSERFEVGPAGSDRIRIVARDDEETLAAVDSAIEGTSLRVFRIWKCSDSEQEFECGLKSQVPKSIRCQWFEANSAKASEA